MFPDLNNYFGEYSVIISGGSNGKSCENKTQIVINSSFPSGPHGREVMMDKRKLLCCIYVKQQGVRLEGVVSTDCEAP